MKMDTYPKNTIEQKAVPFEQDPDVPIIDFIRHGETAYDQGEYKEGKPRKDDYIEGPLANAPQFQLDPNYRDLKPEGIKTIKETGKKLSELIDKEGEMVLILSSRAWRANSSALEGEKELRDNLEENGANLILNKPGQFKFMEHLNDTLSRAHLIKDEDDRRRMEAELFEKLLRHLNNIYSWLKPETLEKLKGKRLRIICFTHAEMTSGFLHDTFNTKPKTGDGQKNSQILEIKPQSQIKAGSEVLTNVKLYSIPKNERQGEKDPATADIPNPEKEAQIKRGFKLEK